MSVASNIKSSLTSSRNFLRNLRQKVKNKRTGNSFQRRPKNFTFDHGQFPRKKAKSESKLHILLMLPFLLIITFGGLAFFLITLVMLFFLHGIKLLWEGYNYKSEKRPKLQYRLKLSPKKHTFRAAGFNT